jgi:hypothetical protein
MNTDFEIGRKRAQRGGAATKEFRAKNTKAAKDKKQNSSFAPFAAFARQKNLRQND